jgi:hypothetical protein
MTMTAEQAIELAKQIRGLSGSDVRASATRVCGQHRVEASLHDASGVPLETWVSWSCDAIPSAQEIVDGMRRAAAARVKKSKGFRRTLRKMDAE